MDPGAAASIPREKGEGDGEIYFFQLLHLLQLSLGAFCGDSSVATEGESGLLDGGQGRPLPAAGSPRRAGSAPPWSSSSSRPRALHYGRKIFASSLLDDAFLCSGWPWT